MKSEKIDKSIYSVIPLSRADVRDFIEEHHYSHSINGVKTSYCFGLFRGDEMIGAMLYGQMATKGQWEPYGKAEASVLELRRMVLLDDTPRNSESYFIGRTLKWLKKNTTVATVVSYADPAYGHEGIVYKASNFRMVGVTAATKVVVWGDREYHDRALRTKYNGKLKPFAQRLVDALEQGDARFEVRPPKNIYIYNLRKEMEAA